MLRAAALSFLLLSTSLPAAAQTAPASPAPAADVYAPLPEDQAAMKAHVLFLASDALRGREAGTPDYEVAAQYVASQFYAQGLRPAGDDGSYLQKVPMVRYRATDKGSLSVTPAKGGAATALVFGEDYLPGADPARAEVTLAAPVVFVGWGIDAPQFGIDSYKGVNVRGKIVAYFSGAPDDLNSEIRAHLGRTGKAAAAMARGAVGTITLESPVSAKVRPFARSIADWDHARMTWAAPDGTAHVEAPATPSLGGLSLAGAAKLFAGAKTPWETIVATAEKPAARFKSFALPVTLSATLRSASEQVVSYNVAGLLPGSDAKLGSETVVLSAHLDHIGISSTPDARGDTINNGAMDNAVGIAALIEEARRFKQSGIPPKRSVLFLAVTAEEKGLIGSDYFATNPTLPKQNLVADVNLDMPILTYRFEDVIAFGADRSTLGPLVRAAAAEAGVAFSPDPMPEQSLFVRSDHYRFVQQGIPSVFLWPGTAGPGKAAVDAFLATNYHKPSDEIGQSPAINWESGVRFIEVNYRIARGIADAPERPRWNKGDFFGTLYGGIGAR